MPEALCSIPTLPENTNRNNAFFSKALHMVHSPRQSNTMGPKVCSLIIKLNYILVRLMTKRQGHFLSWILNNTFLNNPQIKPESLQNLESILNEMKIKTQYIKICVM
jgi:hypothetical protein